MRRRKISSCLNCYKRKIKCDRKKPSCSACERTRIPAHLCIYTESPLVPGASNDKKLVDEIASLREEIRYLKMKDTQLNTKTEGYDISSFYVLRKRDERAHFFGPTSLKTITSFSVYKEAIVYNLSNELVDNYKSWKQQHGISPMNNRNLQGCLDQLGLMLTSNEDISVGLKEYLHSGMSISSCIHEKLVFDYFITSFETETKESKERVVIKENCNLLKLCVVLCIFLEYSIINHRFVFGYTEKLFSICKVIFSTTEPSSDFPTLYALLFLYQVGKYDYNADGNGYKKSESLWKVIQVALSLGLQGDFDDSKQAHPGFKQSLVYAWNFILWEDCIYGMQKGIPSLIHDGLIDSSLVLKEDYDMQKVLLLLRDVNVYLNLRENSKHVDLDHFIHRLASVKALWDEAHWKLEVSTIGFSDFKVNLLCRIQALCHLRYIVAPNKDNKYESVKYTLILFSEAKEVISQMKETDREPSKFASFSYFHNVKEALFRCEVFFMLLLFELNSSSIYVDNENRNSTFSETKEFSSCNGKAGLLMDDGESLLWFLEHDFKEIISNLGRFNFRSVLMGRLLDDVTNLVFQRESDVPGIFKIQTDEILSDNNYPNNHLMDLIDFEELENMFIS